MSDNLTVINVFNALGRLIQREDTAGKLIISESVGWADSSALTKPKG